MAVARELLSEQYLEQIDVAQRIRKVLERPLSVRAALRKSPLGEFIGPKDLSNGKKVSIQEVLALHLVIAAGRSGIWDRGKEKHLFMQKYSFGGKEGHEVIYQTQANMLGEMARHGLIDSMTAELGISLLSKLLEGEDIMNLVLKWPGEMGIALTQKEKNIIKGDVRTIKTEGEKLEKFIEEKLKNPENISSSAVNQVNQIAGIGTDFLPGLSHSAVLGTIAIIAEKIPTA